MIKKIVKQTLYDVLLQDLYLSLRRIEDNHVCKKTKLRSCPICRHLKTLWVDYDLLTHDSK